ncbi:MAG TPA: hypothetical protein PKM57_06680 [Kiritimatiellia bacterium]|nr:hypothetical protein [Kiritimatiellia bacterium]HPS06640.1 hypothetical protein [Kiritimatiellia bacterium]
MHRPLPLQLLCLVGFNALAASPNLLENGSIDFYGARDAKAEGWQPSHSSHMAAKADMAVCRSPGASLKLSVADSAPVDWYTVSRTVQPLKPRAAYTLSAWVRTDRVRDGAGAYISLNFFDAGGRRLAYSDSSAKATGSGDWRRITSTGAVPDGASTMKALLTLHGRGTAWFDDVQAECAGAASAFQLSESDVRRREREADESRRAAAWLAALPPRPADRGRIAVLAMDAPPAPTACPSDPATLVDAFTAAGHAAFAATPEQVANRCFLDPAQIDLLVIPSGDAFPAAAHRALTRFLQQGGAFLSAGGYAFDRPLVRTDGAWLDPDDLPIPDAPLTRLMPPDLASWRPSSNRPGGPALRAVAGPHGLSGVELVTPGLTGWDTAGLSGFGTSLPAGWAVTRFWAKGDAQTTKMWVEWSETDGSRWHKAVELGTEWREYRITPAQFSYWQDNPSVGRGGADDGFRPGNAAHVSFGVAVDIAERNQPHTVALAGLGVQADPLADARRPTPHINTRWARIRDALWPEPEQIGVFDGAFPLRSVAATAPAEAQAIIDAFDLKAPLAGYSATAMLGVNGHGFGPNRARWVPLLACADADGRPRGHAGAVTHHYSDCFSGSSWACFGVTNRDLFARGSPALSQVLLPVTETLLRRFYVHESDAAYACYRAGETVTLRTRVSDFGREPHTAEVRFVITPDGASRPCATLTRPAAVKRGETLAVEAAWPLPATPSDFYRVDVELWESGRRVDIEETAFAVWSPKVIARGPALARDGTRFLIDGRPQFLMGCQNYWGQNGSVTARAPLGFAHDYRAMRDAGLRWTRCFVPFKTEEDKRISDAMVQLAQKFGLVFYHTPNLGNTADPDTLAQQRQTAREIAERYRDVPGFAVDICNEPSFRSDDAALVKSFGQSAKPEGDWDDPVTTAFWWHMTRTQRTWAATNAAAVHAGDPGTLASVGWSQGWGHAGKTAVMKDPALASLNLDFTDRHYYGKPGPFAAELKDVDLRGLGKPFILGEFGAKNHPTFKAADPWGMGDDDASYDQRFSYLAHHAFGLGVACMSSWHWRDPMEGVFPCGLVHQTGVPRPTAQLYRAMALTFGTLTPKSVTPEVYVVIPDSGRQSGQREAVIRAFHKASDLLIACRANFGLLPDGALDRLPREAKALIYPVPFDPDDAVIRQLTRFVEAGGNLYVSGDLSYDAQRKPTKRDRLPRLCGVEAVGEPRAKPLEWPPALNADSSARPFLTVKAAGAEVLAVAAGTPVLTRNHLGKGQVWFNADPVELDVSPTNGASTYLAFLRSAGIGGLPDAPDAPSLHVFHVPGEDADAWIVSQASGTPWHGELGGFNVALPHGGEGVLIVGRDGALRAAGCEGTVRKNGRELLSGTARVFAVAQDGGSLADTKRLLVLPIGAGDVRIARAAATKMAAEAGEIQNGVWRRFAPVPTSRSCEMLVIAAPAAHERDMIRVTRRSFWPFLFQDSCRP